MADRKKSPKRNTGTKTSKANTAEVQTPEEDKVTEEAKAQATSDSETVSRENAPEPIADDVAATGDNAMPDTATDSPDAPVTEPVTEDEPATSDAQPDAAQDDPNPEGTVADIAPEPDQEPDLIEPAPTPDPAPAQKRGGFLPMLLGGVAAGAIGFGAASYLADPSLSFLTGGPSSADALNTRITAQDTKLAELNAAIPDPVDLGPVMTAVQANADGLKTATAKLAEATRQMTEIEDKLTTLSARVIDLEKRPISEGVSDSAIKAYEDELDRLKIAMQAQRSDVESLIEEARKMEAEAAAASLETQQRAGLIRVLSVIEAGNGYADQLAALTATGLQIPNVLSQNVAGVASLSRLKSEFPAAARNALALSRGDGNSSVGDFLRTQLGVRSLEPRPGSDPDAVLSRAEAALASGDLAKTLAEIDGLSDAPAGAMAEWRELAQTRLDVVTSATGLLADLNSN